ncbi:MAG TPA: ribosomal protein S18-alanine N-acetyltransferase [Terracidiphilus sp.]|jgi:ribosomal-protein-alanine N-acetyltransferase
MNSLPQAALIRRMTPADIDRVMEITGGLKETPHWPHSSYLAALDREASLQRVALVVEEIGSGAVAGLAVATLLPPDAELELIAVDPAAQRLGLAQRLFAELTQELRTARVEEVLLEVRFSNQPALALYRKLGFVETGRRKDYYQIPVEDALLMRLGL